MKKIWAIFSGLGFAFLATSLLDMIKMKPNIASPIAFIGFIVSVVGVGIVLNSLFWLSSKKATTPLKIGRVYEIVRHPMYLGGIFFAIGLMLMLMPPSLLQFIILDLSMLCFFIASRMEDNFNIEKFGDKYKKYMDKVPPLNFIKGLKSK